VVVIISSRTAKKRAHLLQGGAAKPGDLRVSPATSAGSSQRSQRGRARRFTSSSWKDIAMLARIRKMQEENEGGFTLIELLVVIIIIGILAAIAIPVFLNQRQKGYDAAAKSDARNLATLEETYLTDKNSYVAAADAAAATTALGYKPSANVSAVVIAVDTSANQEFVSRRPRRPPRASGTTTPQAASPTPSRRPSLRALPALPS